MPIADETGVVQTEKEQYVVSKKDMIELRRILDKLKIHYILDRVSFHCTEPSVTLAKAIHEKDVWKVEKDGSVNLDNLFGHSSKFKYGHLVVPGYHLIKPEAMRARSLTSQEKLFLGRFK